MRSRGDLERLLKLKDVDDALLCSGEERVIWDKTVPGLGLRPQANAKPVLIFQRRIERRTIKRTLGGWPPWIWRIREPPPKRRSSQWRERLPRRSPTLYLCFSATAPDAGKPARFSIDLYASVSLAEITVSCDGRAAALGTSTLTGLLAGDYPARQSSLLDPIEALQSD